MVETNFHSLHIVAKKGLKHSDVKPFPFSFNAFTCYLSLPYLCCYRASLFSLGFYHYCTAAYCAFCCLKHIPPSLCVYVISSHSSINSAIIEIHSVKPH